MQHTSIDKLTLWPSESNFMKHQLLSLLAAKVHPMIYCFKKLLRLKKNLGKKCFVADNDDFFLSEFKQRLPRKTTSLGVYSYASDSQTYRAKCKRVLPGNYWLSEVGTQWNICFDPCTISWHFQIMFTFLPWQQNNHCYRCNTLLIKLILPQNENQHFSHPRGCNTK